MAYQVLVPILNFNKFDIIEFENNSFVHFKTKEFLVNVTQSEIDTLIKFELIKELF